MPLEDGGVCVMVMGWDGIYGGEGGGSVFTTTTRDEITRGDGQCQCHCSGIGSDRMTCACCRMMSGQAKPGGGKPNPASMVGCENAIATVPGHSTPPLTPIEQSPPLKCWWVVTVTCSRAPPAIEAAGFPRRAVSLHNCNLAKASIDCASPRHRSIPRPPEWSSSHVASGERIL